MASLKARSDRLDSISRILRHQGVPDDVIDLAKRPQRESTAHVYSAQWTMFVEHCRRGKIEPFQVTESQLATYLLGLYNRGLQPSTIKVHRSAILSVLKYLHPKLSESVLIADLLRRFEIDRPRQQRVLPKFDIDLVLRQFLKPPFIDDRNSDTGIPLQTLAYKVAFLLALATGNRSSELHALSRSSLKTTRDEQSGKRILTLNTHVGFLAKNQRPDVKPSPVQIHSMDHCVGQGEPERLWCPVRCTQVYLARTPNGAYSVQDTRVLRHPDPNHKTTKGHVALWIRMAISTAYTAAGADPVNVNAHEVRALAHSLSAYSGATVSEVLEGGKWSSANSFFRHYLREMTGATGSLRAPIVAAGRLVHHD